MTRDHSFPGMFPCPNFPTICPELQLQPKELQFAGPPLRVSCSGVADGISWLNMKKLTLGKTTLHSIEIQVISMLRSLHEGEFEIRKITPLRKTSGSFVRVDFRTSSNPSKTHARVFAVEKVGDCCDVWVEPETYSHGKTTNKEAA
jgi:hypothetical protein